MLLTSTRGDIVTQISRGLQKNSLKLVEIRPNPELKNMWDVHNYDVNLCLYYFTNGPVTTHSCNLPRSFELPCLIVEL